jgi:hypothetical protein
LNSPATPDQALVFEGLRGPYQFYCVAKRGTLLLLFLGGCLGDAEDGQTSIVYASRQLKIWNAETLLETSESTTQILLV